MKVCTILLVVALEAYDLKLDSQILFFVPFINAWNPPKVDQNFECIVVFGS